MVKYRLKGKCPRNSIFPILYGGNPSSLRRPLESRWLISGDWSSLHKITEIAVHRTGVQLVALFHGILISLKHNQFVVWVCKRCTA